MSVTDNNTWGCSLRMYNFYKAGNLDWEFGFQLLFNEPSNRNSDLTSLHHAVVPTRDSTPAPGLGFRFNPTSSPLLLQNQAP